MPNQPLRRTRTALPVFWDSDGSVALRSAELGREMGRRAAVDTICIKLIPDRLLNPDLDIRYALPDLLVARSGGTIQDDGYDYASDRIALLLYLKAEHLSKALVCVVDVIENVSVLGNDLRSAALVAFGLPGGFKVVYPRGFEGPFVSEPLG